MVSTTSLNTKVKYHLYPCESCDGDCKGHDALPQNVRVVPAPNENPNPYPGFPLPTTPIPSLEQSMANDFSGWLNTLKRGIFSHGKVVATEPFKNESVQKKDVGGIVMPGQKTELAELKVLFGNDSIQEGWSVFVPAKHYTTYGKAKYELDGKTFILVPENEILLIKRS